MVRQVSPTYGAEGELLALSSDTEPVSYSYDAAYRLASIADGKGQTTAYGYNPVGYLASVTYPGYDGVHHDVLQFPLYDAHGRSTQRQDARGVVTNYVYSDTDGRLSDMQYPATPGSNVHLTYDTYGRPAIVAVSDGSIGITYQYDDRDAPTSVTTTYAGLPAKTITYGYYPDGSRQTLGTPAGSFAYNYDGDGRLVNLTNPNAETSSWTYLDNGWLSTQQLANGATTTYTHNATGVLTDITTRNSGGSILSEFGSLAYDGAGNRTSVTASLPAQPAGFQGATTYQYDSKDELTLESSATRNGGYSFTFGYDSAGNPTTFKGTAQTFNSNNQRTGTGFAYDNNGNATTYKTNTLTYDPENRLTAYGTALTCGYRSDGLRAWKQGSGARTYFLYDGDTPVIEMDSSGNVTAVNTFGPAGLLARRASGATTFYTFDQQGNVAQRLNSAATVLSNHLFDAYGTELSSPVTTDPFAYGAQWGYYTDRETGLQLLSRRYYDPTAGRFLTRDPLLYAGGLNLYAYVEGNPTNAADPGGLAGIWADRLRDWYGGRVAAAKAFINDTVADPSLGYVGIAGATLLTSAADFSAGLVSIPSQVAHYGEGAGCFAGHPSLENLPGLLNDFNTTVGIGLGIAGAAQTSAARGAAAGEQVAAEEAGDAGACRPENGGCFVAGTPLVLADGSSVPIEQVQPGDLVLARAAEDGKGDAERASREERPKLIAKRVLRAFEREVDETLVLTFAGGERIETTANHPFYVAGRGFVEAGKLGIGTEIVTRAGPPVAITGVARHLRRTKVYNLTIDGCHTYFVGQTGGGVWVHNTVCGSGGVVERYNELVEEARGEYPNKANRFEQHHVDPKYLGGDPNGATEELDAAYHQKITSEFREQHGYGKGPVSPERLEEIKAHVDGKYPLPSMLGADGAGHCYPAARTLCAGRQNMKEIVEFRIPEYRAERFLERHQGETRGGSVRVLVVDAGDPLYERIGAIHRWMLQEGGSFFLGWDVRRHYDPQEMERAELFHLLITTAFEPAGEECGTIYDELTACPECGAGRQQVSDLVLDLRRAPKTRDIARTIANEWIVSQRLAERLVDARVTGFELLPVRHKARCQDDAIDLTQTPSGRALIARADAVGVPYGSWEFSVWLNRTEQEEPRQQMREEYRKAREETARSKSATPVRSWYQLVVTSPAVSMVDPTRFGIEPFDETDRYRCPLGHVSGLNLLSESNYSATH